MSKIKRLLSVVLVFATLMTVLVGFPPIEVGAADGKAPSVALVKPTIEDNYITLKGKITGEGGGKIDRYGFGYKINNPSSDYDNWAVESGSISINKTFSYTIPIELKPGDIVYYVILAGNEYGEGKSYGTEPVPHKFEVSKEELSFDANGGSDTFKITTSLSYKITAGNSWISISATSGTGNKTVTVTCAKNKSTSKRGSYVNVTNTATGETFVIDINQDGATPDIDVSEDYLEFSADGGTDIFEVYAEDAYTISENLSWISLSSTSGSSDKTITVTCNKNTSSSSREGTITVKQTSTGDIITIEIFQEGAVVSKEIPSVELDVSDTEIELGDSFSYSGEAYGNDYILNTVTVGISYFTSESNYENGIGNSVYFRNTGLLTSSKSVSETINTGAGVYITGTDTDTTPVKFYLDKAGIYTVTLHGWSNEYGKDVTKTVKIYVNDPEEKTAPNVELEVNGKTDSCEIKLGESFTYSGTAFGNDYTLNTVTVGISYHASESDLKNNIGDSVYFRYPFNIPVSSKYVEDTIATGNGAYINGTNIDGKEDVIFYLDRVGIYTVTLHGYSSEYGDTTKTVTIYVNEQTDIRLGDVNGDGAVTNKDRFVLNRYLAGMAGYTDALINKLAADIDGDEKVSLSDAEILTRHLAAWSGYENLEVFKQNSGSSSTTDTSKWTMKYSTDTTNIVVSLVSGTPDSSKNYLFVAENSYGLHYSSIIYAGSTTETFGIKALQMPRGQKYTYYVVPDGIALTTSNKATYCIGSSVVPLYGGSMISATANGSAISYGEHIYPTDDIVVKWYGSYGVDNFTLEVFLNESSIVQYSYNHSGSGMIIIANDKLEPGDLLITGTVKAPLESGLSNAVYSWRCIIEQQSTNDLTYRTDIMNKFDRDWFAPTSLFEKYDDFARDEISIGLFDLIFSDITDLGGVIEKVVGGDADVTNAKHAIMRLVNEMDDEVYGAKVADCADVIVMLYEWIQETPYDDIREMFEEISGEANAVISTMADVKKIKIDNINNSLSQYIEYLFDIGMDNDAIMEKYAEIMVMQNKNLSKKAAVGKVQNAVGAFSKATKGIMSVLEKVSTVGDILSILYNSSIKDYSAQLIKLGVIEDALTNYRDAHLATAATELKNEMKSRMQKLATDSLKYGIEYVISKASGLWVIVAAGVNVTVGQDAMAKRDACYILQIEDALYFHVMSLKQKYINSGDEDILESIRLETHAIADCRAMLNSLGMELNSWGIFVTDKDKYDYFSIYHYWYYNQHDDIDNYFSMI